MNERKTFATRLDKERIKSLKILSANSEKTINTLLEEAVDDLLKKYDKAKKTKK